MKNKKKNLSLLVLSLAILALNNNLQAQTFINPFVGFGVTTLNYPVTLRPFSVDQEFSHKRLYSPSIYLGFSVIKSINEYWGIDLQSDISLQKFSQQDHSFNGSNGAYFWQFRNSVIPNLNIDSTRNKDFELLQSLNLGLGYRFRIKKK